MLEYQPTKYHAGIELWGDFASLNRLYSFVRRVVEESSLIESKDGLLLGLAYDLRKAFEGKREQDYREYFVDEKCRVFGVKILWPVLLLQVAVLRTAMAYITSSKLDQALIFELEYVVESAISEVMPVNAGEIISLMRNLGSLSCAHIEELIDSRCVYFIELPSKSRLRELPKLMASFDEMYGFLAQADIGLHDGMIQPDVFSEKSHEWPDFLW